MSGRRFSDGERAALYVAANGRCTNCDAELGPGWHADHRHPYIKGGATDVVNGQALCPACNLQKGSSIVTTARTDYAWQERARRKFDSLGKPKNFLVSATPGSGKTRLAITMVNQLIRNGDVQRVVVVVPTDALRDQWADVAGAMGLHLKPVTVAEDYVKIGYAGCVVTYAQLARGVGADLMRSSTNVPTVAILDEIHHAGEERSWGDGLAHALEFAKHRIALTGTPWRRDQFSRIPFTEYPPGNDNKVKVDVSYEYGAAVADRVCRQVEFNAYDGEGRWLDCGKPVTAALGADLAAKDVSGVLDAIYSPRNNWMPTLLYQADIALDDMRRASPDVAGLVVADSQGHAAEYAEILLRITGTRPMLVLSDPGRYNVRGYHAELDAKAGIDQFRCGRSKWIVAVRMVSEGVDIPRLGVGVFASRIQTPLFFRQVIGRIVRARPGEELNARLFIPSLPSLMTMAHDIEEELRHQLELERTPPEQCEPGQRPEEGREWEDPGAGTASSDAAFDRAIYSGDEYSSINLAESEAACLRYGFPVSLRGAMAKLLRDRQGNGADDGFTVDSAGAATATRQPPPPAEPRFRQEEMLRDQVSKMARKRDYMDGVDHGTHDKLLYAQFGLRKRASVEVLEQMLDFLNGLP